MGEGKSRMLLLKVLSIKIYGVCASNIANKRLVMTMPAHRSFSIRARHKSFVLILVLYCRLGRWHGLTSEALAISFATNKQLFEEHENLT
jgi:hypothetical protein